MFTFSALCGWNFQGKEIKTTKNLKYTTLKISSLKQWFGCYWAGNRTNDPEAFKQEQGKEKTQKRVRKCGDFKGTFGFRGHFLFKVLPGYGAHYFFFSFIKNFFVIHLDFFATGHRQITTNNSTLYLSLYSVLQCISDYGNNTFFAPSFGYYLSWVPFINNIFSHFNKRLEQH